MLTAGTSLGPYKILGPLGAGGMGEVYRASDSRLGRDVAIKVLPSHLASTPEVRARFEREARTISRLSHPHICTLFDIGHQNGIDYLVMELIEGETLAHRLQKGPLPVAELLTLGKQIAEALDRAHQAGVVHRDLKPGNVMLTRGGAKLMDFGLARAHAAGPVAGALTESPTVSRPLTAEGTIVGTLQYMAPEQLEGKEADARSDIWALGCVLYEMATGVRAFAGESQASLIAAIMDRTPRSMSDLRPVAPPALERIVNRCIEKVPDARFQSTSDLAFVLESLSEVPDKVPGLPGAGVGSRAAVRRTIGVLAGVGALALLAFLASRFVGKPSAPVAALRWQQLTFSGKAGMPALSPDGTMFAYVAYKEGSEPRVMVQDISAGRSVEVFRAAYVNGVRWTPAGNELVVTGHKDPARIGIISAAFFVPRMGGNFRTYRLWAKFASLSPDGHTLAYTFENQTGIQLLDTPRSDTSSIPVMAPRTWLWDCDWSPDGRYLLYVVQDMSRWSIWTTQRDGTHQREVYRDSLRLDHPRWAPRGGAIYCLRRVESSNELLRIRVTADGGPVRGQPKVLAADPQFWGAFSISGDGRRLAWLRGTTRSSVWQLRRATGDRAGEPEQVKASTASISSLRLSPDGRRLAYLSDEGVRNVHVLSLTDSTDAQITFMKRGVRNILGWSPSGKSLAIVAEDIDTSRVWIVAADASASRVLRRTIVSDSGEGTWWPGRNILYHRPGNRNFAVLDPRTELEHQLVANDSVGWMFSPAVSPDSVHVAVYWNREPQVSMWVVSLADTIQRRLGYSQYPVRWSADGEAVVVRLGNRLMRISTTTGDTATVRSWTPSSSIASARYLWARPWPQPAQ